MNRAIGDREVADSEKRDLENRAFLHRILISRDLDVPVGLREARDCRRIP